jgi:energy-coupling factor transport system ATP-binding protein
MSFVLYKHLNIFVGETLRDEIAFGLESLAYTKDDINTLINSYSKRFKLDHLLDKDPNSLGSSDKVKMKLLSSLIIKPNVLVIDSVLCELDYEDKLLIFDILNEYTKNDGIVINLTRDMEETLEANRIIILHDNTLACDGKTLSVLNEEKLLKRLGLGMPFIVELNKYLMDYGLISKYCLTNEKLVNALWK